MNIKATDIAIDDSTSITLLFFPARDGQGRVPVLELSQETSTLNVHFSAVIKTETIDIPAVYDEIDPARTDEL
jgi:hypothetical protein